MPVCQYRSGRSAWVRAYLEIRVRLVLAVWKGLLLGHFVFSVNPTGLGVADIP